MSTLSEAAPISRPIPGLFPIPWRTLAPWIVFVGLLMLILIYFVGAEEGATSIISGMYVHEFVHDGRHVLAFPCH